MRLTCPIVCIVTRARGAVGSPDRDRLLDRLRAAAAAGATMIHVRERQMDDRPLVSFVAQVREAVHTAGTLVLVNDRPDIAIAAGADGVHFKSDAPPVAVARRVLPPLAVIGRSVHSVEEATAAAADGADYLLFGMVYRSSSKPDDHPIAGLDALAAVCAAVAVPVLAIGGITAGRAADAAQAGAAGVAAISLFADARDIAQTVTLVRDALTLPGRNV